MSAWNCEVRVIPVCGNGADPVSWWAGGGVAGSARPMASMNGIARSDSVQCGIGVFCARCRNMCPIGDDHSHGRAPQGSAGALLLPPGILLSPVRIHARPLHWPTGRSPVRRLLWIAIVSGEPRGRLCSLSVVPSLAPPALTQSLRQRRLIFPVLLRFRHLKSAHRRSRECTFANVFHSENQTATNFVSIILPTLY